MAGSLLATAVQDLERVRHDVGALTTTLTEGTLARARWLADVLPPAGAGVHDEAVVAGRRLDDLADQIDFELRCQHGLLLAALHEPRRCAAVGGAARPRDRHGPAVERNEDRAGMVVDSRGRAVAWAIDGARRFQGYLCQHDVRWFVDQLSGAVREAANRDIGDRLPDVLHDALARVADDHVAQGCDASESWQLWGTVALARSDGAEAEVVCLGDCFVGLRPEEGDWTIITDTRVGDLRYSTGDPDLKAAWESNYAGRPATSREEKNARQAEFEQVFLPFVNRADLPDDQTCWVASPADPRAAYHAVYRRVQLGARTIFLTTDGMSLPFDGDWQRTIDVVRSDATRTIEEARARRAPSSNPAHAAPYPDMAIAVIDE